MKGNLGIIVPFSELKMSSLFTLAKSQPGSLHQSLPSLEDWVTRLLWTFIFGSFPGNLRSL